MSNPVSLPAGAPHARWTRLWPARVMERRALGVALTLTTPLVAFLALLRWPQFDLVLGAPSSHFYVVSLVAALSLAMALAVLWAARRLPDARTFFLAMGFMSMATIFLAHGLGTSPLFDDLSHHDAAAAFAAYGGRPEEHAVAPAARPEAASGSAASAHGEQYPWSGPAEPPGLETAIARGKVVGYSAQLSLLVSALFFALAVRHMRDGTQRIVLRHASLLTVALTTVLAGHIVVALWYPRLLAWIPMDAAVVQAAVAAVTCGALLIAGVRFLQAYRLAILPLQGAMALGMALLIEAQIFMLFGRTWQFSWWIYHLVMLGGFLVCVVALLRQYRLTGDLGAIVEGLFLQHRVRGIRAGDPHAMSALVAAVAAKDSETADHIARVGELSVALGRRLGLPQERLELLRWAGRLHDVGKIGVPASILRKPGRLTADEYDVVKVHTLRGGSIAARSQRLEQVAPIIRAHHERMDGSGYPDGLAGEAIPIEARIVAVADVWDALICARPYKPPMPPEEAAQVVAEAAGPHLDPRCVDALFDELGIARERRAA